MLEIKALCKAFGQKISVDNVTFTINSNTIVALYSENSKEEKATLINIVSGHLQPDSGQVLLNHKNIIPLNPCQRKELGLSYVAHESYLFDELTIADHVLAVARNSTITVNELYAQWRMDRQFLKKSFTTLAHAGIDIPMETTIKTLSALKKKMLTLGLAMLEPFEILVWEEPLENIEQDSHKEITKMILELKKHNKTIFFTCSELSIAKQIADQILVIDNGKVSLYESLS